MPSKGFDVIEPVAFPVLGFLTGQFLKTCHHDTHNRFSQIVLCAFYRHIPNTVVIAPDNLEDEISQPFLLCTARCVDDEEISGIISEQIPRMAAGIITVRQYA